MNKLLEVKELTYRKNLKTILDNVNLDVDSGKILPCWVKMVLVRQL